MPCGDQFNRSRYNNYLMPWAILKTYCCDSLLQSATRQDKRSQVSFGSKRLGTSLSVDRLGLKRSSGSEMAAVEELNSLEELDVVAVLPAGGCGVRMNMELPKQVFNLKRIIISLYFTQLLNECVS